MIDVLYVPSERLSTTFRAGENPRTVVPFGDRLDQIREQCGYGVEALAKEAQINRTQMENLLNRIYPPSLSTLQRLAAACGVPIDAFLDGVRTRSQPRPGGEWAGTVRVDRRPPPKRIKQRPA